MTRPLEPLERRPRRTLGEARRELRARHARRLALAAELGLVVTDLVGDDLVQMLAKYHIEQTPTE